MKGPIGLRKLLALMARFLALPAPDAEGGVHQAPKSLIRSLRAGLDKIRIQYGGCGHSSEGGMEETSAGNSQLPICVGCDPLKIGMFHFTNSKSKSPLPPFAKGGKQDIEHSNRCSSPFRKGGSRGILPAFLFPTHPPRKGNCMRSSHGPSLSMGEDRSG